MENEEPRNGQLTYAITLPTDVVEAIEATAEEHRRSRKAETEWMLIEQIKEKTCQDPVSLEK